MSSATAQPAATAAPVGEPASSGSRLTITVVTSEADVPTLQERVSSWFDDGTEVSVGVASALPPARLFTAGPREVQVWLVPLSPERALILFSNGANPERGRYLLREVRLLNGFDELGLERVASVIHTASVALRAGIEGAERPAVERDLVEAGLLPDPAGPASKSAAAQPEPERAPPLALAAAPASTRAAAAADQPGASLLLSAGYGARVRGVEQLGHGPLVTAGLQLPGALAPLDVLLSAHLLLRSRFHAGGFAASVQTSAFRAHAGFEPALSKRFRLQALLGAGGDLARVSAEPSDGSGSAVTAREPGRQWRGALELSLGVWWSGSLLDLGALAHASYLVGDVHYSVAAAGMQQRLVTPWPVQPGLSLQARVRSRP